MIIYSKSLISKKFGKRPKKKQNETRLPDVSKSHAKKEKKTLRRKHGVEEKHS